LSERNLYTNHTDNLRISMFHYVVYYTVLLINPSFCLFRRGCILTVTTAA